MVRNVPIKEKNIVFTGFMGVGKTTIGKMVAKKLYRDFVDIDDLIEREWQMPVSEIFNQIGEKAFREKEKELVIGLSQQKLKVISLGGGAFLQEEIRRSCLSSSIVFFLDLSWDSWKERISILVDSRPVLQGKTIEEIEEIYHKRQGIYESHHSRVRTDHFAAEEIADYIVESIKLAWELYN